MFKLKHREKLLGDIVWQLTQDDNLARRPTNQIRVAFLHQGQELKVFYGLGEALDAISNDLYWDGEGNWSEADTARLDTF